MSELAERLDTSEEKIIDALNSTRVPLSLTAEYDSEGNPQIDVPTDDIQDEISERLSLEQAVKSLCDTDRKIIQLRYYRSKTQTQTAKILSHDAGSNRSEGKENPHRHSGQNVGLAPHFPNKAFNESPAYFYL